MQKTLLYFTILAILGFGVWYFLFSGPGKVFADSEANFTIRDTDNIGKILLADNAGQSITLVRKGNSWTANGLPALESQVQYLLLTMAQQEAVQPVASNLHNGVVRSLAGTGIKVEVYDIKNNKIRVFYVGGEIPGFGGTYMLLDGAKRPYIVNIKGYDGYLSPRYSTNIHAWRDRTVFQVSAENLLTASVQYDQQPLNSFRLERTADSSFRVTLDPQMGPPTHAINMGRARTFSAFFDHVNAEGVENGRPGLDSILRRMPRVAVVDVTGKQGYHQKAVLYFFPINKRSKNMTAPITDTASYYDSDHYYAIANDGRDTFVMQQHIMDKIFRYGYQFFEDDKPSVPEKKRVLPQIKG